MVLTISGQFALPLRISRAYGAGPYQTLAAKVGSDVFPVHTGITQKDNSDISGTPYIPRAYEDGPMNQIAHATNVACSPCIRGWSQGRRPRIRL